MKYCKDCKFLTAKTCMRLVNHIVKGPDTPLDLSAMVQRLDVHERNTINKCYHNRYGYCGVEGQYWEERPPKEDLLEQVEKIVERGSSSDVPWR